MRLVPLFEMVYRYVDRQAVELTGPRGSDGLYWMFREGTLRGDRIAGSHKGMNRSTLRVDSVATGDIRGIIQTVDKAMIYYEIRAYGLDVGGPRHVIGSITFMTGDPRYRWLNTVIGVLEGRYTWGADGLLTGTAMVYECLPESRDITPRRTLHEGLPSTVPALPPNPETEPEFAEDAGSL